MRTRADLDPQRKEDAGSERNAAAAPANAAEEPSTSVHPLPPGTSVRPQTVSSIMTSGEDVTTSSRVSRASSGQSGTIVPRSGTHPSVSISDRPSDVSAHWLERLLVLSCALPTEEGEAAVARALAMALSQWIELPIGVCLVAEGGGQEVVRVLPGGDTQGGGIEPARLFRGFAVEQVFVVRVDASRAAGAETTLHIASDAPELDQSFVQLGEHAAMVLGSQLATARRHLEGRRAQRELNKLQGYIIQADKLASMGQLAAGVVHELNNPLTSIVAYTEYLLRKGAASATPDTDDLERLRRIGESAGRMLRLTRDLVTYARPSSDIAVPVAIEQVIEKALAFCEHVLGEAGARIERHFAASLPPVRGMPEELAQVFVNLVTNACHAVPRGDGVLVVTTSLAIGPASSSEPADSAERADAVSDSGREVRTTLRSDPIASSATGGVGTEATPEAPAVTSEPMREAGGGVAVHSAAPLATWIEVTIEDNGHGIDEQHLPHIFAPFFTTKGEGRGTGLGLAIVKNILDKHAGAIHAESSPSGGTRFVLRFPALS